MLGSPTALRNCPLLRAAVEPALLTGQRGVVQVLHERRRLSERPADAEAPSGVQVLVTCAAPVDDAIRAQLTDAAGIPPARFMPETSLLFFLHDETAVERLGAVEGVVRSHR